MTTPHSAAKSFEVFPDEMMTMVKFFNHALHSPKVTNGLDEDELNNIISFIDDFKTMALNWSI
tara:strand:+ start:243 stop:431 length:189 start_codon:yes stop_codon:yes gene_type:complete